MTITETFYGPPFSFYGGTTGTVEALWPYHVALDGRPYAIDVAQYERGGVDPFREGSDTGAEAGEQSLVAGGIWKRSIDDWRSGSGQSYQDDRSADRSRFFSSYGLDVWDPHALRLLPRAVTLDDTFTELISAGDRIYAWADQTLKYSSTLGTASPSWVTPTYVGGHPGVNIASVTSDGYRVWISFGTSIYASTVESSSFALYSPADTDVIAFANGRLFGTAGPDIFEILADGTTDPLWTHLSPDFMWIAVAPGPGNVYAAGNVGSVGMIYLIAYDPDTGALRVPVPVATLPSGETIETIVEYLGFLVIGTSRGVRLAQSDGRDGLLYGPLIDVGGPVECVAAWDRFVWFGWTDVDAGQRGLGRMDLSRFTGTLTPAYAEDLMTAGSGSVSGCAILDGKPYFAAAAGSVYGPHYDGMLTSVGVLTSGWLTFGTIEDKLPALFHLRTAPLDGTVEVYLVDETGNERYLAQFTTPGSKGTTDPVAAGGEASELFRVRIVLRPDSVDERLGPEVRRWTLRAGVAPQPSEEWIVPIILAPYVDVNGVDVAVDARGEWDHLKELEASRRVVTYQEGVDRAYRVRVRSVSIPRGAVRAWNYDQTFFDTVALVRLTQVGV